jgi:hypothetical protein
MFIGKIFFDGRKEAPVDLEALGHKNMIQGVL